LLNFKDVKRCRGTAVRLFQDQVEALPGFCARARAPRRCRPATRPTSSPSPRARASCRRRTMVGPCCGKS